MQRTSFLTKAPDKFLHFTFLKDFQPLFVAKKLYSILCDLILLDLIIVIC